MNLGPFYFQKRDLFILLAIGLLVWTIYFSISLPLFAPNKLLLLAVLFLLVKGALLPARDVAVFLVFLTSVFLTLFLPLFQVVLFLVFAFFLLKLLRAY